MSSDNDDSRNLIQVIQSHHNTPAAAKDHEASTEADASGWGVSVNGFDIPMWVSVVAFFVSGGLALGLWRETRLR